MGINGHINNFCLYTLLAVKFKKMKASEIILVIIGLLTFIRVWLSQLGLWRQSEKQHAEVIKKVDFLYGVSGRVSSEEMAKWFHDNYEEIAKAEGWQTQDKCKVEFHDLPESSRNTMIKVCDRWLDGC